MGAVRPQAIFLDVDGTYANDRGLVPESARRAVITARRNGHRVFLCTGRPMPMLFDAITEAGFDGIIASAGGYVELDGEVLAHRTIPVEDIRHVVEFFDAHGIAFILESTGGLYGSTDCEERLRRLLSAEVDDADTLAELHDGFGWFADLPTVGADLARTDITKVSFFDSPLTVEQVREEFAATFDVIPSTVRRLGANSGEMAIRGVHKAIGIDLVLAHLGLHLQDTIAYGDGFNDIEMLQRARTGIAMADADPLVKAVADGVTGAPDDDGIATSFAALGLI